jgi:AcrR family transcriptional regulator
MNNSHISPPATFADAFAAGNVPHRAGVGRRERRGAETRLKLFRCALQLIAERGFSNVTVEEITEAADVGKGTFFNYFESKDHVLGVMAEIQLDKMREALLLGGNSKRPMQSVLRHLMLRLAEEPGRSPSLARAFISSFQTSEGVRSIIGSNLREGLKMIEEVVATGQERLEIDPRLKKDKVAIQLLQTCMGTVLLWSLHGEPALEARMEDSFQHFWRAIAASGDEQEP